MEEVRQLLQTAIAKSFDTHSDVELTRPDPAFGDCSTNIALQLGKTVHQNPRNVAEQIIGALPKNDLIESCSVAGPGFINITVKSKSLALLLRDESEGKAFGKQTLGEGKTVICEFPSPNMAKPLSVGHLRAALQGWAIYKLMDFVGYTTVRDNHVGDSGTPFGKWVVGFLRHSSEEKLASEGIYELARIYVQITEEIKQEKDQGASEIQDEVQAWLQKLESGDAEAKKYSERFNKLSFEHMHKVMQRLNVEVDEELGESFFVERGQKLTDKLLEKNIATKSEGAVIVDLEDEGIKTPIMLRKANGTALYSTTDLGTIDYRQERWNPVHVFVHTGQEQAFYFEQLKGLARKAGYEDTIVHLWHGLVDQVDDEGNRAKMSSRKGVVLLEEFLDKAHEKAAELAKENEGSDVEAVMLGAVKFADFKADRKTGLLFDWDDMFSLSGFSGPAVQYAAVRIKSILAKAGETSGELSEPYEWQTEKALLLKIAEFPGLIRELHDTYQMQKLAHYLYELTSELNRYYEQTPILKSEAGERNCRLWTISLALQVLQTGMDILGIPVPERM